MNFIKFTKLKNNLFFSFFLYSNFFQFIFSKENNEFYRNFQDILNKSYFNPFVEFQKYDSKIIGAIWQKKLDLIVRKDFSTNISAFLGFYNNSTLKDFYQKGFNFNGDIYKIKYNPLYYFSQQIEQGVNNLDTDDIFSYNPKSNTYKLGLGIDVKSFLESIFLTRSSDRSNTIKYDELKNILKIGSNCFNSDRLYKLNNIIETINNIYGYFLSYEQWFNKKINVKDFLIFVKENLGEEKKSILSAQLLNYLNSLSDESIDFKTINKNLNLKNNFELRKRVMELIYEYKGNKGFLSDKKCIIGVDENSKASENASKKLLKRILFINNFIMGNGIGFYKNGIDNFDKYKKDYINLLGSIKSIIIEILNDFNNLNEKESLSNFIPCIKLLNLVLDNKDFLNKNNFDNFNADHSKTFSNILSKALNQMYLFSFINASKNKNWFDIEYENEKDEDSIEIKNFKYRLIKQKNGYSDAEIKNPIYLNKISILIGPADTGKSTFYKIVNTITTFDILGVAPGKVIVGKNRKIPNISLTVGSTGTEANIEGLSGNRNILRQYYNLKHVIEQLGPDYRVLLNIDEIGATTNPDNAQQDMVQGILMEAISRCELFCGATHCGKIVDFIGLNYEFISSILHVSNQIKNQVGKPILSNKNCNEFIIIGKDIKIPFLRVIVDKKQNSKKITCKIITDEDKNIYSNNDKNSIFYDIDLKNNFVEKEDGLIFYNHIIEYIEGKVIVIKLILKDGKIEIDSYTCELIDNLTMETEYGKYEMGNGEENPWTSTSVTRLNGIRTILAVLTSKKGKEKAANYNNPYLAPGVFDKP